MRLPRDISSDDLIKALQKYGYTATRQTGSHLRLTRISEDKQFHLTIPKHKTLRIGTLNNILKNVAVHLKMEKDQLIKQLF